MRSLPWASARAAASSQTSPLARKAAVSFSSPCAAAEPGSRSLTTETTRDCAYAACGPADPTMATVARTLSQRVAPPALTVRPGGAARGSSRCLLPSLMSRILTTAADAITTWLAEHGALHSGGSARRLAATLPRRAGRLLGHVHEIRAAIREIVEALARRSAGRSGRGRRRSTPCSGLARRLSAPRATRGHWRWVTGTSATRSTARWPPWRSRSSRRSPRETPSACGSAPTTAAAGSSRTRRGHAAAAGAAWPACGNRASKSPVIAREGARARLPRQRRRGLRRRHGPAAAPRRRSVLSGHVLQHRLHLGHEPGHRFLVVRRRDRGDEVPVPDLEVWRRLLGHVLRRPDRLVLPQPRDLGPARRSPGRRAPPPPGRPG